MRTFLALYRGHAIGNAKVLAVSTDPDLVSFFARALLNDPYYSDAGEGDRILSAFASGRLRALELIGGETKDDA